MSYICHIPKWHDRHFRWRQQIILMLFRNCPKTIFFRPQNKFFTHFLGVNNVVLHAQMVNFLVVLLDTFFFKKSENIYFFCMACLRKHKNHINKAYLTKFNHFAVTFHFPTPKERNLHCSHEIMLKTKLTHSYTYCKSIKHHYTIKTLTNT